MPKVNKRSAKGTTAALNARINAIRKDIRPMITVRGCRGNPKPLNKNRTVYVTRTYPIEKTAANSTTNISLYDIITAAVGAGQTATDLRISMIKMWNTSLGSSLTATCLPSGCIDNSIAASNVQGVDYGTSSSLAGLKFDVPDTLAIDITEKTSSDNVITATTGGATDKILAHVTVRMAV